VYLINQTWYDAIGANPHIRNTTDLVITNTYTVLTSGMIRASQASGDPIGLYDPLGNGVMRENPA
jgi:hypothetical protein